MSNSPSPSSREEGSLAKDCSPSASSRRRLDAGITSATCRTLRVYERGSHGSRNTPARTTHSSSTVSAVRSGRNTRLAPTRRRATHTLTARSSRTYPRSIDAARQPRPRLSAPRRTRWLDTPVEHVDLRRHSESAFAADRHASQPTAVGDSKTCHWPRADAARAHVCANVHVDAGRRDPAAHFGALRIIGDLSRGEREAPANSMVSPRRDACRRGRAIPVECHREGFRRQARKYS